MALGASVAGGGSGDGMRWLVGGCSRGITLALSVGGWVLCHASATGEVINDRLAVFSDPTV